MADGDGGEEGDDDDLSEEEVRAALRAVRSESPTLGDVLRVVQASLERGAALAPQAVVDAVEAKWETDGDFANGGADQFAWNHGAETTHLVASLFRAVGAIENADLLDRLAAELAEYNKVAGDGDAVQRFLAYRTRVGGPFFNVPEPGDELAEVLVEYAIEHAAEFADPAGPLPALTGEPSVDQ